MKLFNGPKKNKWSLKKDLKETTLELKNITKGSDEQRKAYGIVEQGMAIQNQRRESIAKVAGIVTTAAVSIATTILMFHADKVGDIVDRTFSTWQQRHHRP